MKMRKKRIVNCLAVFLVAIGLPVHTAAETCVIKNINYDLQDGHATVLPLKEAKYEGRIVIPETIVKDGKAYSVTSIGPEAFARCENLTSIVLPSSIETIRSWAFLWCSGLHDIDIPNSINYVAPDAFYCCKNMPVFDGIRYADNFLIEAVDQSALEYYVRSATRWIGDNAFSNCTQMKTMSLPESVEVIGNFAFSGCASLQTLELPSGVTQIGAQAFSFTALKQLICRAEMPPTVLRLNDKEKYFDYIDLKKCHLKVNRKVMKLYSDDVAWREFKFIKVLR